MGRLPAFFAGARADRRAPVHQRQVPRADREPGEVLSHGAVAERCAVHFYRNVWTAVPTATVRAVAARLKAIRAQEDHAAAPAKAALVVTTLREMKLAKAAEPVAAGIEETRQYFHFPSEHWRSLRTNNPLERLMRAIRRRARAAGAFPDGNSALILVSARLRHVVGTLWGRKRYRDMGRPNPPHLRPASRG